MEVKLFANLAETAEARVVPIAVNDGATIRDALDELFAQHPTIRAKVLTNNGEPHDHINILVDGSNISHGEHGLEMTVDEDAEIAIFPPVSGG